MDFRRNNLEESCCDGDGFAHGANFEGDVHPDGRTHIQFTSLTMTQACLKPVAVTVTLYTPGIR